MPPIIAPGVCRFTVNGTYGGQVVANIIDMEIDTTGSIDSREDAIFAQAGILINEWSDSILEMLVPAYVATSVSWIDLNSLDGPTGNRTSTDQQTWPLGGQNAEGAMPGNVAMRVDKQTTASRGQRKGRMYLPGLSEAFTLPGTPNTIDPAQVGPINGLLQSFLGDLEQTGTDIPNYESRMVVVHTVDGVYESDSRVTALTVNTKVGSQVRRLR